MSFTVLILPVCPSAAGEMVAAKPVKLRVGLSAVMTLHGVPVSQRLSRMVHSHFTLILTVPSPYLPVMASSYLACG